MTTPPTPCQTNRSDLWFSESPADQRQATKLCEDCPLSRYAACRQEGWNHEFGVWGGLTPVMRKRMDRKRYDVAVAGATLRSGEIDDVVVDINGRNELANLVAAGLIEDGSIFEIDGPGIAELLALEA